MHEPRVYPQQATDTNLSRTRRRTYVSDGLFGDSAEDDFLGPQTGCLTLGLTAAAVLVVAGYLLLKMIG